MLLDCLTCYPCSLIGVSHVRRGVPKVHVRRGVPKVHVRRGVPKVQGQKGTKRLVARYGDALLCVRYRHDKARGVRLKTVEIIVGEKAIPAAPHGDGEIVPVAVAYTEKALQAMLKAAGGRWDPHEKVWHVAYGSIRGTELEGRILRGRASRVPETATEKFPIWKPS